jgi:hypothetical protein
VEHHLNSGPGHLIVEECRSHTHKHTYSVTPLWMGDQPIAEATTCTTHNKHKRRPSMPSAGFEPTIPAIERLQNNSYWCCEWQRPRLSLLLTPLSRSCAPCCAQTSANISLLAKVFNVITTTIVPENKMARRLDENTGTHAGGRSVTEPGRCEDVDKEAFFQQPQYNRFSQKQFIDYKTKQVGTSEKERKSNTVCWASCNLCVTGKIQK